MRPPVLLLLLDIHVTDFLHLVFMYELHALEAGTGGRDSQYTVGCAGGGAAVVRIGIHIHT